MKQIIKTTPFFVLLFCVGMFAGCGDYLNVVPENIATLDNAFSNRINSERFFYGCYNMIPNQNEPYRYPGHFGADEVWHNREQATRSGARIAMGDQSATGDNNNGPLQNYWEGRRDGFGSAGEGKGLWVGIRDCNIFLENIDRVPDLQAWERIRWVAEVKFIKAYLHYFLLQLYGPIPIVDENIAVNADPETVRLYREPVDKVVDYIVDLIDECMPDLPEQILETATELGRVSQPIAASLKAKVLVWAASPLLNGNPDYANFKDKRDVQLIPSVPDNSKWERALEAIDTAIEMCHANGHRLFRFNPGVTVMSPTTRLKYTLRGVVTERPTEGLNTETIWAHPAAYNANTYQAYCTPKLNTSWGQKDALQGISATLKIAEQYYSNNGVPIDEDVTWHYVERYETRRDTGSFHQYYIKSGETTANVNYYREPRFYAHLSFDRGLYEMLATPEASTFMINNLSGALNGVQYNAGYLTTGYFVKKLVSFRTATTGTDPAYHRYTIPLVRLGDLYLLRAEAANEVQGAPDNDGVYRWVDSIRTRAGLEGVVDSWAKYSELPNKPSTKDGMREIIKRERLIELAFEGQRPFDLRRWKDAMKYQNQPVQGWNHASPDPVEYYRVTNYLTNRNFTLKDYLWPIWTNTIIKNDNLVQNPGW